MSFINKNLSDKPSLVKPIAVVVVILLLVGGIYGIFGGKSGELEGMAVESEQETAAENAGNPMLAGVKPTGLDGDKQVKTVRDVELVVAKWVEANPHMVLQSVANMQKKIAANQAKNAQQTIGTKKDQLFNDKTSATYAPAGYDVEIVEFFDYNCGYCKRAQASVEELIKTDKKVKIIYKEFPILGQPSMEMAQVSVAVNMNYPKSYKKFHDTLMTSQERGKDGALEIVKKVGLDVNKIKNTLKNSKDEIDATLKSNLELGSSIGINGTPGFVIGEELSPGALDVNTLKAKVAALRAQK